MVCLPFRRCRKYLMVFKRHVPSARQNPPEASSSAEQGCTTRSAEPSPSTQRTPGRPTCMVAGLHVVSVVLRMSSRRVESSHHLVRVVWLFASFYPRVFGDCSSRTGLLQLDPSHATWTCHVWGASSRVWLLSELAGFNGPAFGSCLYREVLSFPRL